MNALLLARALAGMVGPPLLVSACGGSPGNHVAQLGSTATTQSSPSTSPPATSSQPTHSDGMLAFSRCVREHGVTNYPDPDTSGHMPDGAKQIARASARFPAAENACGHLLSSGAGTLQQRQQKLAFGLKLARCIRAHGFPAFPDPTASGQIVPAGIDPSSRQFTAAATACKKQAQQAVGLP